jgi:hypothetical protein
MKIKDNPILQDTKTSQGFASRVQLVLILALTICFALIIQRGSEQLYGFGLVALIILTLLQIAFGNIPANTNLKGSLLGLLIATIIIGTVVALGIWIAPYLLQLGR